MVEAVRIKDMRMLVTPHPAFVSKDASTDEIAKVMIANPRLKSVFVVYDKLQLIGKITLKSLIKHEFMNLIPGRLSYFCALEFVGKKTAEDIMIYPVSVKEEDTLKTAFIKMYEDDLDELPVVDEKRRLIGNIDLLELLTMLIEKKEQNAGKNYLSLTSSRPFHK
jgi:CBS domain-containing protein